MPKKSRRSVSRKLKRSMKRKSYRKRGGMAPLSYHLSGSWPSRMSLGQGADYFKYHEGQHGGAFAGAPLSAIDQSMLPEALRGPAHIGGIDKAIADVRGLKDQNGGRRKNKNKKRRAVTKKNKRKQTKKYRKSYRKRGGMAPFPSKGMLLNSSMDYAKAGLNPEWKTDVAFTDAKIRNTQ
jgi:hypothetical protein